MWRTRSLFVLAFATLSTLASPLVAQSARAEARVRAKIVDNRIVIRCQLTSHVATMPAYLFLAYDRLCGVELHNQATNALEIEDKFGNRKPFQISFPGLDIDVEAREHGDEDELNDFTKLHGPELEEIGVLGTLGANLLMQQHVTFDLANGFITIGEPKALSDETPRGPEQTYVKADATTKLVWLPVTLRGEVRRVVGIGSAQYDSVVDEILCEELEALGGDIGSVEVAGIDLSRIVPWRPEELPFAHEDGALGVLGINFLRDFRVDIDRVNGWVGLTRTRASEFPIEEREFFQARATEEIDEVHAWLKENQKSRLAGLAAESLLLLHMDNGSPLDKLTEAVTWVNQTRPKTLRATRAIDTMEMLTQARLPEGAVVAGKLGIEAGNLDRYPESVHRLHVRLGEILLGLERNREAWEHLMSAAFGLNEAVGAADQAKVNLLLGQYYERMKRYKRAASRYVQAVITPEAGEAAIAGLTRVQSKLGGDSFSVDLVDRLISGKVRAMTAPTKFEVDEATDTNRTVLVEHVTNPHLGVKKGERWRAFTEGGSMIFQAVMTHFPPERVVMLGYHSGYPRPVGITNELSIHAASRSRGQPVFFVDGRPAAKGAAEYDAAERGYAMLKRIVRSGLAAPSAYGIELDARLDGGTVRGNVKISGPANDDLNVEIILAERGVLYPGLGATVVHRMVARASLVEAVDGVAFEPQAADGAAPAMVVPFSRALTEIETANRAFLDAYEEKVKSIATRLSVGMDPQQLVVIVCVRDTTNGAVLQAAQLSLADARKGN